MKLSNDLLVVDVETTGENPFVHDLLSLALVPVAPGVPALEVYVRPEHQLTWTECGQRSFQRFASEWHRRAVSPVEAMASIANYIHRHLGPRKATLIGHNVGFDVLFLRKLALQAGHNYVDHFMHRTIDTHTLLYLGCLQNRWPETARTSDGAFRIMGIPVSDEKRHTALGDAEATRALFLKLAKLLVDDCAVHLQTVDRAAR